MQPYDERLTVPRSWWLIAVSAGIACGLIALPFGTLPFLGAFIDLLFSPEANETAAGFVRAKIREIVKDPKVADRLTPKTVENGTSYWVTSRRRGADRAALRGA